MMRWKPEFAKKTFTGKSMHDIVKQAEKNQTPKEPVKYEDWAVWFDNKADIAHGYVSLPEDISRADMPETITINCVTYVKKEKQKNGKL